MVTFDSNNIATIVELGDEIKRKKFSKKKNKLKKFSNQKSKVILKSTRKQRRKKVIAIQDSQQNDTKKPQLQENFATSRKNLQVPSQDVEIEKQSSQQKEANHNNSRETDSNSTCEMA